MAFARQEAARLRHDHIGTEHMLLGLLRVRAVADLLCRLGVEPARVREEVEAVVPPPGSPQEPEEKGQLPFTPRAKRALELTLTESEELGGGGIGVPHLLLGLVREGDGVAARVLGRLGLRYEDLRAEVVRLQAQRGPPRSAP
jgi:ATP-dependent Clp protease ATP-binding subunit ClpC